VKEKRRDAAVAMNCLASVVEINDGGDDRMEGEGGSVCCAVRT